MTGASQPDVTRLLAAWGRGDENALEELAPIVYGELRRRASRYLRGERTDLTIQTHDLVHEAFLRLVDQRQIDWRNRSHFFAIAARMMRRVLVDHARSRGYAKRGGDAPRVALDEAFHLAEERGAELVALDAALTELAEVDKELARIIELRYFAGLKTVEIAEILEVSEPTVRRRFRVAKAWLYRSLSADDSGTA